MPHDFKRNKAKLENSRKKKGRRKTEFQKFVKLGEDTVSVQSSIFLKTVTTSFLEYDEHKNVTMRRHDNSTQQHQNVTYALILLLVSHSFNYANGLSSLLNPFAQKQEPKPIKRVAIIGSGICGLSLAHALENSESCAKPYLDALSLSKMKIRESDRDDSINSRDFSSFGIETCIFDSRSSLDSATGAGE